MTHEYVLHKLSTQPNRATGADGISAKLIKISASHIATPLTLIIHLSLETGVMPATWKHARVTIPTNGCGTLIDNLFCKMNKSIKKNTAGILLNQLSDHLPCFTLLETDIAHN